MDQPKVQLLDLPNEILFFILGKLENIDVLYSLFNADSQRLQEIVQEPMYTSIFNFTSQSQLTREICPIAESVLDRICTDILPRIHQNVKSLIVECSSLERILHVGDYPNLTELKLFNFNNELFSDYLMNSLFEHVCRRHLTDLVLVNNDFNTVLKNEMNRKFCAENVSRIISKFENLKHLSLMSSSINSYSPLSLDISEQLTFCSSTLTKLCIDVYVFDDCLILLNGSLKMLTTFIVRIDHIYERLPYQSYSSNDLPYLKCLSLTSFRVTAAYYRVIPPLVRRMSNLEELSLYVDIMNKNNGATFVSGAHIDNEILQYLPRLHTFAFYFSTYTYNVDPSLVISKLDMEQTFKDLENRPIACIVDVIRHYTMQCHVFSLPFKFDRLEYVTNNIPNLVFDSVIHVQVQDTKPFYYEFFSRLTKVFPFLKKLSIYNVMTPNDIIPLQLRKPDHWSSIVVFRHLTTLEFELTSCYYVEHLLSEAKTHLPCFVKLIVDYELLKTVTNNFTRDELRSNCANVKRLVTEERMVYSKDVYDYFPSL